MLNVTFAPAENRPLRLLCLGAHSDDIEIGCGGTILRLLSEYDHAEVHWVVFGSSGQRDAEALASAEQFLSGAGKRNIVIEHFKDGFFPYRGEHIKSLFEALKTTTTPDLVFTHCRDDLHQDHRLISELTWNTYRDHMILEYEVAKYDGDLGHPNVFVPLDEATCKRKIDLIMESFTTQKGQDWFTPDAFLALLRLRGIESKAPWHYAEAFYGRKVILQGSRARGDAPSRPAARGEGDR
jgi:LmbE family N-acetylglucosaminyl deacetylase